VESTSPTVRTAVVGATASVRASSVMLTEGRFRGARQGQGYEGHKQES